MKLVFVHGRDQQGKDRAELQRVWEEAFFVGLEKAGMPRPAKLTVAFPFYGDELEGLVKQLDAPLVVDVATKGAEPDDREASFRGELLADIARNAAITDDEMPAGSAFRRRGR